MCGGRYGLLLETNNMYAPTRNGFVRVRNWMNALPKHSENWALWYISYRSFVTVIICIMDVVIIWIVTSLYLFSRTKYDMCFHGYISQNDACINTWFRIIPRTCKGLSNRAMTRKCRVVPIDCTQPLTCRPSLLTHIVHLQV